VIHRERTEQIAKAVLLAVTVVLVASMGGGFLALPVLIPAHIWAAHRSRSSVGRIGWSALPAVSVGMVAWAAVYVLVGEETPVIWLAPALAFIVTLTLVGRAVLPVAPRPGRA
jgi:hypothetical protein